tara:strand:+ start:808 stop:1602 length:795 start_codon:yes stop_codon:yes gene_type:complete
MSQVVEINTHFWLNPPWDGGKEKYRLGLKPISREDWFEKPIFSELKNYKRTLFNSSYHAVVRATDDSLKAQELLTKEIPVNESFPDLIASMSLEVPDDLCIIESGGSQRLLAASVCSPSYWNLQHKIGEPLRAIHKPVKTLNEKIGNPIERFIRNAPLGVPFKRENWFIHGDDDRFHLESENYPSGPVDDWFVRSERETICRYHEDYSLFAINVRFQPLSAIESFDQARKGLIESLNTFDHEEKKYFGGARKYEELLKYLNSLS